MSEIIVTFEDEIKNQNIESYKKKTYISLPRKKGDGYMKTPISRRINERTILIDNLKLTVFDSGSYWFSVYNFDNSNSKDVINNLLIELSKLHKTTYKIVGWVTFWDFINNFRK